MIKKIFKTVLAATFLLQASCATIATEPKLSKVELVKLAKPKYATCSVSFVYTRPSSLDSGMIEIIPPLDTFAFKPSVEAFEKSGLCGKVTYRQPEFVRLNLDKDKEDNPRWLENYTNSTEKDSGADLTVNFYFRGSMNGWFFVSTLMSLPSLMTFGMFPVWVKSTDEMWMTTKQKGADKFTCTIIENSHSEWFSTLFWLTPWRRSFKDGDIEWYQKSTLGSVKSGINVISDIKPQETKP